MLAVFGLVTPAKSQLMGDDAAQLKHLLQPKFAVAEVLEAAGFASRNCPGFHIMEDNFSAELHSAGASDDDIHTPEFEVMAARGRANAAEGHAKNPSEWCASMWQFLGPTHPPMIKHTLLTRD